MVSRRCVIGQLIVLFYVVTILRRFPRWMSPIGAADPATHKIYIWDISNDGQFASALDGGREPLIDVHVSSSSFHNPVPISFCFLS